MTLRDYSCFMSFRVASPERAAQVIALGARHRFDYALSPPRDAVPPLLGDWCIELDFSGKDFERRCVRFLVELAALVGEADGEMRCGWYDDKAGGDQRFEFYRIAGGRLIYQSGRIERGAERIVAFDEHDDWTPELESPDRPL